MNGLARVTYRAARKIAVAVVGGTLVLVGIVLIFMPGPAFIVIPAGLGVLALEFEWARRWLRRLRAMVTSSSESATNRTDTTRTGAANATDRPYVQTRQTAAFRSSESSRRRRQTTQREGHNRTEHRQRDEKREAGEKRSRCRGGCDVVGSDAADRRQC